MYIRAYRFEFFVCTNDNNNKSNFYDDIAVDEKEKFNHYRLQWLFFDIVLCVRAKWGVF